MVSKGFPNLTTSGRQYTLTLISMQGHQNHNPFYLRVLDYSVVIWSYMVLERLKLNLINISI